ncbi:hypothetical protein FP2506_15204 [Fulvimarina pelagi HTCC2506]|uniref:Uncharacterized protein n=1 Tax=Fulvimarina pelagi HTCC2506 TaxID=314231 RepID=Q0G3N9_9HYPH|nr:hypothetical protein FP2506_15204 [Fulvimarina pelagi HTCC2506]
MITSAKTGYGDNATRIRQRRPETAVSVDAFVKAVLNTGILFPSIWPFRYPSYDHRTI